jgi:hypothetical protein
MRAISAPKAAPSPSWFMIRVKPVADIPMADIANLTLCINYVPIMFSFYSRVKRAADCLMSREGGRKKLQRQVRGSGRRMTNAKKRHGGADPAISRRLAQR